MSSGPKAAPSDGFPPPIVTPGVRASLDASFDSPRSATADSQQNSDSATEEVRTLLGSRASDGILRARKRLLRGFYAYSIASEVFVIVAGSLFLPVALETYARENGRLSPHHHRMCPASSDQKLPTDDPSEIKARCVVKLLGMWLDTASFSLFVYSASVALQAITVISMGGLADNPYQRHRLLTTFATIGSILCVCFLVLPSDSPLWPLCGLLALGANISVGASLVCLNSYLPDLGRSNADVVRKFEILEEAKEDLKGVRSNANSTGNDRLHASQALARAHDDYALAKGLATSRISSTAIASGYASGILGLVILFVPVSLMGGSVLSLRIAIAGSGAAWGLGTIPAAIWLRPGSDSGFVKPARNPSLRQSLAEGWRGLGLMIREWRRLPNTFTYLAAWFLLSDAVSTLTSTAMLFAKTSLMMTNTQLIIIAVVTPCAGICGAFLFPRLQATVLPWSNLAILSLLVVLSALVPLWGLWFLHKQWQIYLLATVFGVIYGSFQSFARSCFAELVPTSQAARWFGLYSITDKSSAFLGPALVAGTVSLTGSMRYGFIIILVMLLLSLPILYQVDMEQGRKDADAYQRELVASASAELAAQEETETDEA